MGCLKTQIRDLFYCLFSYQSCCILDTFHRHIHSGLECALSRLEHTCKTKISTCLDRGKKLTDLCQTASARALSQTHGTAREGDLR